MSERLDVGGRSYDAGGTLPGMLLAGALVKFTGKRCDRWFQAWRGRRFVRRRAWTP